MVDGVEEPNAMPSAPTPLRIARELPRPSTVGFVGEAGFNVAPGLLPHATLGAFVGAGVGVGGVWSITANVDLWGPSQATVGDAGARIWAIVGEAQGCFALVRRPSVRFETCLVGGAGMMSVAPIGLVGAETTRTALPFAGPALALSYRVASAVWVRALVSAWVLFNVPEYFFRAGDGSTPTLFRTFPVVPVFTFGFATRGS